MKLTITKNSNYEIKTKSGKFSINGNSTTNGIKQLAAGDIIEVSDNDLKSVEEVPTTIKELSDQNKLDILEGLLTIIKQDHSEFDEEETTGWDLIESAKIWWDELKSLPTRYSRALDHEDDIYTVEEWKQAVEEGSFNNYDGSGYWVKDGFRSKDEVFSTPQLDATHVVWYNK